MDTGSRCLANNQQPCRAGAPDYRICAKRQSWLAKPALRDFPNQYSGVICMGHLLKRSSFVIFLSQKSDATFVAFLVKSMLNCIYALARVVSGVQYA